MGMFAEVIGRKKVGTSFPRLSPESKVVNQGVTMKFAYGSGDQPLDGYTIKRGVGIGGFGEVYFAVNEAGKEVALKRIQRNLDVEVRGVRQCINLRHPNLVGLYDIKFDASEQGWIVMEYVSGQSLREMLDHSPSGFDIEQTLQLFGQIAAGVTYLHDQGIVHRDLKPANIFSDGGLMKIGDYGLSKFISCSRRGGQTESVGTFHYMAPEIGKGEYGKEIDIYALGIILFELLTGNVPFDGESGQEIILKHLTADPDVRGLPEPYANVIAKALAKNPASRFRDVREMIQPLGLVIDPSGLANRNSVGPLPGVAVDSKDRASSPPVLQPLPFMRGHATTYAPQANAKSDTQATRVTEVASVLYREPIAKSVQLAWFSVQRWWSKLAMNASGKNALLAVAALVIIFNAPFLVSMFVSIMFFYVPYYVIYLLFTSGQKNRSSPTPTPHRAVQPLASVPLAVAPAPQPSPSPPPTRIVKPVAIPKPQPLTLRQWQTAQRHKLATKPFSTRWYEATSSMVSSTAILAVLGVIGSLVALGTDRYRQPGFISAAVWTGAMSLAGTWTILFLSKRWESREEDRAIFRFKQLTAGLVLGGLAYALSRYLMVPWSEVSNIPYTLVQGQGASLIAAGLPKWHGFYDAASNPLLPAFLGYFSLMMGGVRWWRQADIVRKSRFSLGPLIASVAIAGLVQLLVPFPQPWSLLVAGCMAFTTQLSTPWIDSSERLNPQKPDANLV